MPTTFATDMTKEDMEHLVSGFNTMDRGDKSNGITEYCLEPIFDPDPIVDTTCPGCFHVAPAPLVCLSLPFICCNFATIYEREHAAAMYCGRYVGSIQSPGFHLLPCCCLQLRRISTATRTMSMKGLKVVDSRGNPVVVSAVVTFEPTSAKKASIDVQNPWPNASLYVSGPTFLQLQAEAVLKQITSRFPYEAPEGQPSLQTEGASISHQLISNLQSRVMITGARILSFDLVDLSYAPEIAQAMLVRQQASALVDARKLIVEAAVDMTTMAVAQLEEKMQRGAPLPDSMKDRLCANLLTVVCSNEAVTPTIGVGTAAADISRDY
ncbi:SPFH domain / Band 7 family protein [Nitzschia inconspicua]|uniref:SPFH domain / Band 7 family protein n=1 Tax=Nitzschia inconspicua TaxID=303405 RepID=A0A9K3KM76_9STRA|nr:SPFH domain / Band 7 family protein [Nitzschia inconspicua]